MSKSINPTQIKIIHTAVSKLGLSDQIYRDILHGHYKAESCKDLSYAQASALIDHFKTLGFRIKSVGRDRRSRRNTARNVTFLPSREQFALIDQLKVQIKWQLTDGFQRWLAKYLKISRITTSAQAQRCIEGLKGMIKNSKQ
jgi:hypothetical protein